MVWDLGVRFRIYFWIWGLGFGVQRLGFRVRVGFRVRLDCYHLGP